jgi:glucose-6-phosphate isomerase
MKNISCELFNFLDSSAVEQKEQYRLDRCFELLESALHNHSDQSPFSFINLPFRTPVVHEIKKLISEIHAEKRVDVLVVVGIGGSNLGARAVETLLHGSFDMQKIPIFWVDTVDADYIDGVIQVLKNLFEQKKRIFLVLITKSGETLETVANGQVFVSLFMQLYATDFNRSILIISDVNSAAHRWAQKTQTFFFEFPRAIGGRYSIFTAAHLAVLALVGIDVEAFCKGASQITPLLVKKNGENLSYVRAQSIYLAYKNGCTIHDFFVAANDAVQLGNWYRQLLAESLGKKDDVDGNEVRAGIVPTVSVCSTDLHSLGQLYVAGKHNRITTFIAIPFYNQTLGPVPFHESGVENLYTYKQSYAQLMNAFLKGTVQTYQEQKLPCFLISLPEKNVFYLGQLMQTLMVETVLLGACMHVNPFDQPAVEAFKNATKAFLSG